MYPISLWKKLSKSVLTSSFLLLPIRYSLRARHEEMELLEYLANRFGVATAKRVYDKIEEVLELIALYPESYPVFRKQNGLRKCVFSKQTSIYYQINEDHIEIVSFRPNRKDPNSFTT